MASDGGQGRQAAERPSREETRDQSKEVARIAAFSDGVFAIAITLLALQLEVPAGGDVDVWAEVSALWGNFLAFAISFAVIGAYWIAHHRLFSEIERYDGRLLWLNLLSLFFIVFIPFTTSLVGEHGDQPASVVIYALSISGAGFANTGITLYALRGHRLCSAGLPQQTIDYHVWRGLTIALVFLFSLALLPLGPGVAQLSWLSLIVFQRIVARRFSVRAGP
jgi:uncharacterized membrane protein